MKRFNLAVFRGAISEGRLEWRKHVLQRIAERGIAQQAIRDALLTGDLVRDYTEDKPFPSALFLGYVAGKPLHVVASCDEINRRACIITAYEPSQDVFESDFRTKKKYEPET